MYEVARFVNEIVRDFTPDYVHSYTIFGNFLKRCFGAECHIDSADCGPSTSGKKSRRQNNC